VVALIVASIALLVALFCIAVFHLDISPARDFESDVVVRDASPRIFTGIDTRRYLDPSPFSIWLPSDWHVWQSIRSGTLPFWDRMQGGGYSPVVAFQNGALHPLRWIVALFPRSAAPSAFITIALFLTLTGMMIVARQYGFSASASAVAASFLALAPMTVSFVEFSGAILPIAHLPWLVAAHRSRKSIAVVIASALLLLSGHPLIIFVVGIAFGAAVVADAIGERSWQLIASAAVGGLIAIGLVAFALLPPLLAASTSWSYKTHTSVGTPYSAYSLPQLGSAILVFFLDVHPPKTCCIDGPPFYLFTGIPAIALAVVGAIALWKGGRRSIPILVIILLAIAIPGPWMAPIAGLRPVAFLKAWYFVPALVFFLAIALGAGFDVCLRAKGRLWAIVGVLLVIALIPMYGRRLTEVTALREWRPVDRSAALDFLRSRRQVLRITGLWGQTHMPNASHITGIEDVRISAPVMPMRYALWWQAVDPEVLTRAYPTVRITDHLDSALVSDFNIAYVLQSRLPYAGTFTTMNDPSRIDAMLSPRLREPQFPIAFRSPWLEIRSNVLFVRPRAHFAGRVMCVSSLDEAFRMLSADRQLAANTAVVECDHPINAPAAEASEVMLTFPDERHVRMRVRSRSGGLVVLHDAFAPGWRATVDGQNSPILPVNILSRGVLVGPGEHTIAMAYLPPGFLLGLLFSGVTVAILVVMKMRSNRRAAENRSRDTK
jgi:membrane protein YfhO